ncbi:hypothetical protein [Bacteroides sp. UBA939]|uniref:hypothetical protein n=1 Tax=Bacteroides sp. UBA939 TaxID=1946092 RepID=UPI0025C644B3|nr:hypothetical protein [Bacteroides sp. UBA939]
MEEQLKRIAFHLKVLFVVFWLLPAILIVIGEIGGDWVGQYADNVRATYFAETLSILLTAICVPVSLKLFAWVLARKIDYAGFSQALRLYSIWSKVRIALLALPVLAGITVYYLMMSSTGALCACIALVASLFCLPGEERMRKELQINKKEEV